ncbi:MAG: TDP-N-acetylfucosamine:lipid II N-acetylfucosaminyltransferase [Erysipelotrichaceae bacterium]|nr:TDP-N-acetylfucosamine:lipid II N-acetylfucosaminyltransferase [Erysipelotrichaceae bacterium]
MNLHIIPNEKFTGKFVELIDSRYPKDSNLVYIYHNKGKKQDLSSPNVLYVETLFKGVNLKLLNKNDKLFIHGFYEPEIVEYLFLNLPFIKKDQLVLIMWGADLYDTHQKLSSEGFKLKPYVFDKMKNAIFKHSKVFMTFAYYDYNLAHEWYGANGKQFDCLYPSNADLKLLDELRENKKPETVKRIMIGNSATLSNYHEEVLNSLSKFKDENIEIICPLSYGDMKYGQKIAEIGKQIFGDKFIPITEFMNANEYSKLLNSIDVAIFNNKRQQATGNIEIIGYLGKKLYLRSDTSMWPHYVERDKCHFYDAIKIQDMSFEEFIEFEPELADENVAYFRNIWDINYVKSLWDDVFNYHS